MNDGGPAFPRPAFTGESPEDGEIIESHSQQGMSLRDWFAGMALQGFCAKSGRPLFDLLADGRARDAYTVADAMLKARGQ